MIYLDNSATTQPCPQAVEAARTCMEQVWGNPSALYRFGAEAARAEKTARTQVAQALGAPAERVFFTSGGRRRTTGPFFPPWPGWASGANT